MTNVVSPMHPTIEDWIRADAIPFSLDSAETLNVAIDRVFGSLGERVLLLGFGEPLHSAEENLVLRNRLFQRLVEKHGFSAIALESSFPRGRLVNEYIAGRGAASYDDVKTEGFGQGFGALEANRELVEWMRKYNAAHSAKLHFYGFDMPAATTPGITSPRGVLEFVLDYLCPLDNAANERRAKIESLLGPDADWVNPAAYMDPTKSIGLSPNANALRITTEDLIMELQTRRPELSAKTSREQFAEALQHAFVARQFLIFHAAMARDGTDRTGRQLAIRDVIMADNLAYIAAREPGRVLVFAHNAHLQRGKARADFGPMGVPEWWPAGAQLAEIFGDRYAVIGSAVAVSEQNGIAEPEPATLEARLTAAHDTLFIPTHRGVPAAEIASLPIRTGSAKNRSYVPLNPQTLADFDVIAVQKNATYACGGWPLPG